MKSALAAAVCLLSSPFLTANSAFAAPPPPPAASAQQPAFDAGALLEQLNKQTLSGPALPAVAADTQPPELFANYELVGLPEATAAHAREFLNPAVGRPVQMTQMLKELHSYLLDKDPNANYVFLPKKKDNKTLLIAQKVLYDGVTVESNGSNYADEFLAAMLGYDLKPGQPFDHDQIERNATLLQELPGLVNQFMTKPGTLGGSSNVHLGSEQGAWYGGSVSTDNSSSFALGQWATRGDIAEYNYFGRGDIIRLNGQLTEHSRSLGLDGSATVHPSGTRAALSLSEFNYDYSGGVLGKDVAGDSQQTDTRYMGTATSLGLNLSYPYLRTDDGRQNITLDLNHNWTNSRVDITQMTTLLGTTTTNTSSAAYMLSNILVNKVSLGFNGAQAYRNGGTLNFQFSGVLGDAEQKILGAATQDAGGAHTLGGFFKATSSLQYSQPFQWQGERFSLSLANDIQLASHNLVGPEEAYFGGMYRMQAWGPSAVGGAQDFYLKAQLDKPLRFLPGLVFGGFAEWGVIQPNKVAYTTSVGANTVAADAGWKSMSDIGLAMSYNFLQNMTLTGALAEKVGDNPVINGSRLTDSSHLRGWLGLRVTY